MLAVAEALSSAGLVLPTLPPGGPMICTSFLTLQLSDLTRLSGTSTRTGMGGALWPGLRATAPMVAQAKTGGPPAQVQCGEEKMADVPAGITSWTRIGSLYWPGPVFVTVMRNPHRCPPAILEQENAVFAMLRLVRSGRGGHRPSTRGSHCGREHWSPRH